MRAVFIIAVAFSFLGQCLAQSVEEEPAAVVETWRRG
jgi:hypothetical protein